MKTELKTPLTYWEIPAFRLPISKEMILKNVCEHFGVTQQELKARGRKRHLSDARSIISYFLKKNTKLSLTDIGKEIYRDHSTVIYYIKKVSGFIEMDKKYRYFIESFM